MTSFKKTGMRADIQLLRALAIAGVLAHHAKLEAFAGGYLGVDIFFVISGYLITRVICSGVINGNFSLVDFYAKRFRRLLPAAYTVFIVVGLVSPWILDPGEVKKLIAQLTGALTFSANMVLWRQSGYFDTSANYKPLLHIWSLSLEEQFYFILPVFLVLLSRRWWVRGLAVMTLLSCIACAVLMVYKPSAGFYFLPARAWELLLGSLVAQLPAHSRVISAMRIPAWAAWAGLVILCIFPISELHPGPDAVLVCLFTAVILVAARGGSVNAGNRWAVRIGNGSYCLYLVHWPLFAWLNTVYLVTPPLELRLCALVLTFALAWILRKYVEKPGMQFKGISGNRVFGSAVALALVIVMTPVAANRVSSDTLAQLAAEVAPVTGLSDKCSLANAFGTLAECRHGRHPRVLVWGDSYAMHLIPGLQANAAFDFIQATRLNCSPMLDIALVDPGTSFNPQWASECIAFNRSVANFLREAKDIDVVIVASPFDQNIPTPYGDRSIHTVTQTENGLVSSPKADDQALAALGRTVDAIRSTGKRVVLVAAPPRTAMNMSRCNQRKKIGLPLFDVPSDCSNSAEETVRYQAPVRSFLRRAELELNAPVIYVDEFFCQKDTCRTQIDGKVLYRDNGHYSQEGSIRMAQAMNFGAKAWAMAR